MIFSKTLNINRVDIANSIAIYFQIIEFILLLMILFVQKQASKNAIVTILNKTGKYKDGTPYLKQPM